MLNSEPTPFGKPRRPQSHGGFKIHQAAVNLAHRRSLSRDRIPVGHCGMRTCSRAPAKHALSNHWAALKSRTMGPFHTDRAHRLHTASITLRSEPGTQTCCGVYWVGRAKCGCG
ncbi:unnamed protein product [Arctogadus glacialis]